VETGQLQLINISYNSPSGCQKHALIRFRLFSGLLYGSVNNEVSECQYKIKANTAGIFTVPPIFAQAMYEPTIETYSGAGLRRWNKMVCVKKGWLGLSFMVRQTHSEYIWL
jgi:hypothetical protein